ncbi:hypothetical protein WJX74_001688 [Apatococcus lobatus]|uniref:Vps16 N-terminal domain-containing protein n=1 Tax=Apatococcus lobatus TaxID=904363 RepID=A0AAW1R2N0_9CHLO
MVQKTSHELLCRVPDPLADMFHPGSTTPGALLFDAGCLFKRIEARADLVLVDMSTSLQARKFPTALAGLADGYCLEAAHQQGSFGTPGPYDIS